MYLWTDSARNSSIGELIDNCSARTSLNTWKARPQNVHSAIKRRYVVASAADAGAAQGRGC